MFQDDPTEHAKSQNCLQIDLQLLYESNKIPEQQLVAYKGGLIEKDMLKQLSIPAINLEHWGGPKFETFVMHGMQAVTDCGHHDTRHCTTLEWATFWQWPQRAKEQQTTQSGTRNFTPSRILDSATHHQPSCCLARHHLIRAEPLIETLNRD